MPKLMYDDFGKEPQKSSYQKRETIYQLVRQTHYNQIVR